MAPLPRKETKEVRRVIFLDVDGVLNVSFRDQGRTLLVTEGNVDVMRTMMWGGPCLRASPESLQKMLLSDDGRKLRAREQLRSLDSVTANSTCLCDGFIKRLVSLIQCTAPAPEVVLSSSWRQPKHRVYMEALRKEIECQLGHAFYWSGTTPLRPEPGPQERLQSIGASIAELTANAPRSQELRFLVLDDFFVAPFGSWSCEGTAICGPEDAENYLLNCCTSLGSSVAVKVVNTGEEFLNGQECRVQAAFGLSLQHAAAATNFLVGNQGGSRRAPKAPKLPALVRACMKKMVAKARSSSVKALGSSRVAPRPAALPAGKECL